MALNLTIVTLRSLVSQRINLIIYNYSVDSSTSSLFDENLKKEKLRKRDAALEAFDRNERKKTCFRLL